VLTGTTDCEAWCAAAAAIAEQGIDLGCHCLARDQDPGERWPGLVGLERGGAVLVRPDGFIAWRARTAPLDPRVALEAALSHVLATA
jgi:hypothetical protein